MVLLLTSAQLQKKVLAVYKMYVAQPLINFSATSILKANKKISNSYSVLIFMC